MKVSCLPSADSAAEPGTVVLPWRIVIVQPDDWIASEKVICGVTSATTPVAPAAGVREATVTALGSFSKTTSTQ